MQVFTPPANTPPLFRLAPGRHQSPPSFEARSLRAPIQAAKWPATLAYTLIPTRYGTECRHQITDGMIRRVHTTAMVACMPYRNLPTHRSWQGYRIATRNAVTVAYLVHG